MDLNTDLFESETHAHFIILCCRSVNGLCVSQRMLPNIYLCVYGIFGFKCEGYVQTHIYFLLHIYCKNTHIL